MCKRLFFLTLLVPVLGLTAGVALAGVEYTEPEGGWAYIYTGDAAASDVTAALDGTWNHNDASSGGSDAWDGSAPGDSGTAGAGNAPGGAGVFTDGDTTFLRIQDAGDPRDGSLWGEPSNRKITLAHDLGQDAGVDGSTILDDGVTISFRARIPTTDSAGDLDPHYPNGGGGPQTWTTRGYNIHDNGYGAFGIKQGTGGDGIVSFSLCMADDEGVSGAGLVMNKLNGTSVTDLVDYHGDESSVPENLLTGFDPTAWHEFWVTIQADTSGGGTHKVNIYVDGSSTATEFHVTAGSKDEYDFNGYLCMSLGRTDIEGAQDVDFFAYKPGLIAPSQSDPDKARALTPPPGATVNLPDATPLSWKPGASAAKHDVYLGTSANDVNDADATDTTGIYRGRKSLVLYTPTEALELGRTYFWRIDEVEADNTTIHKGNVWSFSIIGYILIDDFEGYEGDEVPVTEQIWGVWGDGIGYGTEAVPPYSPGNGTGSEIGDIDTFSYTEETITHDGSAQSMPYWFNNNKQDKAKYSEAKRTLTDSRNWTEQDVKALSLWFRGYPLYLGGFAEAPAGTYTITAEGSDIWGTSDEFHFAWQQLNGAGTITAKVESVSDTDPWAKAGVMVRDTLDADSAHGMMIVSPGSGVSFQRRTAAGAGSDSDTQAGITAPYWVRLERTSGGAFRAYYSADGSSWTQLGALTSVPMAVPIMYIGLAVTSHNPGVQCEAVFSNVTSDGTGPWTAQDVGLSSNEAVPMYLAVANNTGTPAVLYHEDANATLSSDWTEWNIDLKDLEDKGLDLADVDSIAIGFGDRDNPVAGGAGKMYFDDIRLYRARYVPDKVEPFAADLTGDGIVDSADLQIMINDWLEGDYTVAATTPPAALSWWKLDNNVSDTTGGNSGTPRGNPTYVAGKFGQAINLDGDDYVDLGNPASLDFSTGDWTISAWIKTTQSGTGDENKGTIYAKGGDQTDGIRYTLALNESESGMITLTTDDNSDKVQVTASTAVDDDAWHHVVGMRIGNEFRVYIDGALDGTATVPAGYDLSGTSQHKAYIGVITDNRDATLAKYFNGLIDDVRIYSVALSDTDLLSVAGVTELYFPLTSPANLSDDEPNNFKRVNFRDFAILADEWLGELVWPRW